MEHRKKPAPAKARALMSKFDQRRAKRLVVLAAAARSILHQAPRAPGERTDLSLTKLICLQRLHRFFSP
jgi:hypothetical protein